MDIEKVNAGWIKFYRKIRDWKYYGNLKYEKVWQTLLLEANYDDQDFNGTIIKRGELIYSRKSYLKKLEKCDPKITERNLRTIIDNLVKDQQIKLTFVKDKHLSIIEIINYNQYQKKDEKTLENHLEEAIKIIKEKQQEIDRLTELNNDLESSKTVQAIDLPAPHKSTKHIQKTDQAFSENRPSSKESKVSKIQGVIAIENTEPTKLFLEIDQANDENCPSCIAEIDHANVPTKRILKKLKKNLKETLTNTSSNIPKRFNKKLIEMCKIVINEMNNCLNQLNMKNFDAENIKEVLSPVSVCYKQGHKDPGQYIKIIKYKFEEWRGQINNRGVPMMKYFTPTTLFKRHFDNYLREAENIENLGHLNDFNGISLESTEDKMSKILEDAKIKEREEEKRQQEERKRIELEEQERFFNEEFEKMNERQKLRSEGKLIDF